jgi:hypothetical protein
MIATGCASGGGAAAAGSTAAAPALACGLPLVSATIAPSTLRKYMFSLLTTHTAYSLQ